MEILGYFYGEGGAVQRAGEEVLAPGVGEGLEDRAAG